MTFEEILDQAVAMLQRRRRLTYGTLKRQFELDDAALEDLKAELIEGQRVAVDEGGRVLVWTGDVVMAPTVSSKPVEAPVRAPLTYTPPYLAEKILTSRSVLEGERKQVTVLFADLKDSTELIRGLDPEAAQQLLDPALHHMMDAVHRYEGTVNQVLGDGIMALFGAPLAHEDHALRACYAALAMQAAMQPYTEAVRRSRGLELRMRVGLNAGEVVVRTIGNDLHMDYSAVGETTVLAARMEQMATPGSIRLTPRTLRLVEGLVRVHALGPVPVKGLVEPVEVFELLGASGVRRRLQAAAARGLTRFVGRDQELVVMQQALEQARAGHGQVVALVGEAGVGKSRLVYECVHSHRTQGWRVLESTSVSYGKATPYFPVIDLLKHYCQIDDGDDLRTIRARVTGQVLTLDAALQDMVPALLALLDALPDDRPFLQLDPSQRRQRTLDALKCLLLRESQEQPLLLVFEDLHWIDTETQALLDRLVESLPTARLLLLVNYRPEYQHGWGSKTYYTQLRLDPLPPASTEAFLTGLLGDDPSLASLPSLLTARTAGNPFFLEESVRTLVETAALVGTPGAYRLAAPLQGLPVPATVQAVLAARIDRLAPEAKGLLQTAAVLGTDVPFALLQAIADVPEATLHRSLAHLQAAEFLYETRLYPDPEYTFKHALTHEVAYGSLLLERRRVLHTRIVEALERLSPDRLAEQVDRLAHHALRGEVWDKALPYCWQAGAKAAAQSAHREAVALYEQALVALEHLPESRATCEQSLDLRLDLRYSLTTLGEFGRAIDYLYEAEALAEALGNQGKRAWVSTTMAGCLWWVGDSSRAIEFVQRAFALAATLDDVALCIMTNFNLGMAYNALGDYRRAIDCLRTSVTVLEGDAVRGRIGPGSFPTVLCRAWLARCLAEVGEFTTGSPHGAEGVRMAEAVDHPPSLAVAAWGISLLSLRQGDPDKALPVLEYSLKGCQRWYLPGYFPWVAAPLGYAYALCGRLTEALPLLEQAVDQAASRRILADQSLRVAWLSEAYLLAGRLEEALACAGRALELSQVHRERGNEAWILRLLGAIAAQREPSEVTPAAAHYQQALTLAEELGMRPLQAHCHRGLGTLYAKIGRRELARTELTAAIDLYRAMEITFWLPQAEAALAQVEGSKGGL